MQQPVLDEEQDHLSQNLAAALRHLPLLRRLELSDSSYDDTGLATISSLTNLQALSVGSLSRTSAAGYAALPTSLTLLELKRMPDVEITGSAAHSLAALRQLQHLQLHAIEDLTPTALRSLTQLTHLHLQGLQRISDQDLQQLLLELAGLQQLRHLHAWLWDDCTAQPAAQWTGLVASLKLTYLSFDGVGWQPGDFVVNELGASTRLLGIGTAVDAAALLCWL
jgi:hypothetical protein